MRRDHRASWDDILNRMANDNLAKQLSCSWYIPGGAMDTVADGIFQQMAAQGQSFYSASGDYDAFCGLIPFPVTRRISRRWEEPF